MSEMEAAAHPLAALRELSTRPQWVCWRKETRKGKATKVPYHPSTGKGAESDNPATWGSYAQALATWQQHPDRYDGIGYMFHRDYTGVDLDHCIDADGSIAPWARAIIERHASYAERSPGDGVHIVLRGTIPRGIRRAVPSHWPGARPGAAIEMYCERRYFTITGNHVQGTPHTIEANQEALSALYEEIASGKSTGGARPDGGRQNQAQDRKEVLADDALLLKKACAARNGDKFRTLYYHGAAGYLSASEADLALCLLLAFWTGHDQRRIDRLFRQSALYRDKWDSARGASTYGEETIQKALSLCDVAYDPHRQFERDLDHLLTRLSEQQASRQSFRLTPRPVETSKVLRYLEENEYGDARFFAEVFAGQVCYDHTEGEWYLWHGHHWRKDTTGKVMQLVAGTLATLYLKAAADLNTEQVEVSHEIQARQRAGVKESDEELAQLKARDKSLSSTMSELYQRAKALRSAKRNANVLRFIGAEMGITSEQWDTDPWLLAVPNGVVDLRTGCRRDGQPGDYIRTVTPTEWTGLEAPCPRFEQFLREIFEEKPDREVLIAFLSRLFGYGITGLVTHHLFPILYGEEGRNGKDTLLDTFKAVLGPLAGAVSNDVFIAQDKLRSGGAATPHLCDLQGKRLVWGSETKEGDRLNVAQIKHLTGGGQISARPMYGKQYTFAPTHKLLLITNYKPHADARDKAFWARACLITFNMRFVDQPRAPNERKADPTLKEALLREKSGILAWLVRGCLAFQQHGLELPASVQMATEQYRDEEDRLLLFLQERCIEAPHAWTRAGALFAAYRAWYEDNQFGGRGMNSKLFGDEMKKRFERKEDMTGRFYVGIGLRTPESGLWAAPEKPRRYGGSMEGKSRSSIGRERAREADGEPFGSENYGGYGGLEHKTPTNGEKGTPYIGISWQNPPYPPYSSSVVLSQVASEATREPMEGEGRPSIDTPNDADPHPCSTKWEERKKTAHEGVGTVLSVGCWWCERCRPQREWMEVGERRNYPRVALLSLGFTVKAGHEYWLRFAQEAGYVLVSRALEILHERDGKEALYVKP